MRLSYQDIKKMADLLSDVRGVLSKDIKFLKFLPILVGFESVLTLVLKFIKNRVEEGNDRLILEKVKERIQLEIQEIQSKNRISLAEKYKIATLKYVIEMIESEKELFEKERKIKEEEEEEEEEIRKNICDEG